MWHNTCTRTCTCTCNNFNIANYLLFYGSLNIACMFFQWLNKSWDCVNLVIRMKLIQTTTADIVWITQFEKLLEYL